MTKSACIVLCICIFIVTGCFSRSKPAYMVEQYMIEYAPPVAAGLVTLNDTVKIERFSVHQSFNSQAMVYRPAPFKLAVYNYDRWRVNPGDMVTDCLLRDLRNAKIFRAVFSYRDTEQSRFVIEGGVEEFVEAADKNDLKAVLSVNVSLLDSGRKEFLEKVVFQKQYRFQEPMKEHAPGELARSMSVNLSRFSEQLARDVHKAVMTRAGQVRGVQ